MLHLHRTFLPAAALAAGLILAACSGSAGGGSGTTGGGGIFADCVTPGSSYAHVYYSDPVGGSMDNDGSEAHPWASLADIVAAGKLPPATGAVVAPGDGVLLLGGDHGSFRLDGAVNDDFITIAAAAGESPTLSGITMTTPSSGTSPPRTATSTRPGSASSTARTTWSCATTSPASTACPPPA